MPRRVLIVPDKFKGTLTARQAAEAIERGWRGACPEDETTLLPMSDGGDGFGEIISRLLGAATRVTRTIDAAHRPCEAAWWWHGPSQTAIIESAQAIGLAKLPPGKYHPFELDTEGVGELLQTAIQAGARRCLLGIGGSATNDGGFGLARALGWQFFNSSGERIMRWTQLHSLAQMRPPDPTAPAAELVVAVDVQNPLLGPAGCTRIYGPQKGIRPDDIPLAERCLEQLAGILEKELHLNCVNDPGSGAAGGLGFGLCCFARATLAPGFGVFAQHARLTERLAAVDLLVTGEGAIDASTLMGKGVGELAALCRRQGVPCLALAGTVPDVAAAERQFTRVYSLTPGLATREEALARPAELLEQLATQAAQSFTGVRTA